jgi:hypothetical protein
MISCAVDECRGDLPQTQDIVTRPCSGRLTVRARHHDQMGHRAYAGKLGDFRRRIQAQARATSTSGSPSNRHLWTVIGDAHRRTRRSRRIPSAIREMGL